ncbi:MAG: ABC transporter ATP-binding protein, partial [Nitriliruptor sp.]
MFADGGVAMPDADAAAIRFEETTKHYGEVVGLERLTLD